MSSFYQQLLCAATILAMALVGPALTSAQNIVLDTVPVDQKVDWAQRDFWETFSGKPAPDGWEFSDGEIRLVKPRKGGNIVSPPMPPNFELSWKWKIAKGTNSGLKYRVRRFGKALFRNSYLGLEYQILDDEPSSKAKGSTASIYDLVAPAFDKQLNPPGQWNEARIVAIGSTIQHFLNGKLISSADNSGPDWDAKIAVSKFYGSTDFGRAKEGDRFMLTDHGGQVSFKDFDFTAHSVEPTSTAPATAPFLANAMRNSWADQDSIVIWTRTTARPEMNVDGKRFIEISKKDAAKMAKLRDATKLLSDQLPDGAKLDEMFGACPGAPGRVRLMYFPGKQRNQMVTTPWTTTSAESDFATQWKLEGLKPNTYYAAVIEAQSIETNKTTAFVRGGFRTAPATSAKENVGFCITTCHDFIRRDDGLQGHKIYPAMTELKPDFVVHAGDIEYYDKPDPWALTLELMRFKWGRIFALPANRQFYNHHTSYFLKDDHDTLTDDCWAGQMYGAVSFERGMKLFNEEQFPSHQPRYKTVRWGKDLQVWFLEGRDYRSPNDLPDGPDKTILGAEQKRWLFDTLEQSDSKFKLICSPTPIVGPDRKNKRDNHANDVFEYEGNQIREKLSAIDGVIVFCGDRHWQYASVDPNTGLWEFGSGPGSQKHQFGWKPGDKRPEHEFLRVAGGFLSGQLKYNKKSDAPTLTIRHHKVTGEEVSEFRFPMPSESEPLDESKSGEETADSKAKAEATKIQESDSKEPVTADK